MLPAVFPSALQNSRDHGEVKFIPKWCKVGWAFCLQPFFSLARTDCSSHPAGLTHEDSGEPSNSVLFPRFPFGNWEEVPQFLLSVSDYMHRCLLLDCDFGFWKSKDTNSWNIEKTLCSRLGFKCLFSHLKGQPLGLLLFGSLLGKTNKQTHIFLNMVGKVL